MTLTLTQDLQSSKIRLEEFKNIADRILQYMPAVIDEKVVYHEYLICSSTTAGSTKRIRPFNKYLFMVYTRFLARLEGYYYLDIPKKALIAPYNQHIFPFSQFILEDIWKLLDSA
ncbi:MAG TPA: hypothetical protein ENH29_01145 [Bacteroidetes bacterium]|nr:hypothetical protein [Bacteroidota bacterium]